MEIRRTFRPYLWYTPVLMLLGLWLGSVLAKGASNQSATTNSHAWQRYHSQALNASPALPDELEILDAPSTIEIHSPHETHLTRTSVIFGLTKVANESSVSQKCHAQLRQMQRGILGKQPWAMKGESIKINTYGHKGSVKSLEANPIMYVQSPISTQISLLGMQNM